jgi:hypothetical protein
MSIRHYDFIGRAPSSADGLTRGRSLPGSLSAPYRLVTSDFSRHQALQAPHAQRPMAAKGKMQC